MGKMAESESFVTGMLLKQICLKVKSSQMKNLAFCVLFFQMSSVSLPFTYQSKKCNEDIYFLESFKKP